MGTVYEYSTEVLKSTLSDTKILEDIMAETREERYVLNCDLAKMLKGGVIMDVTNVEEAKIAEEAGAVAVMALERVPSDIRKQGGVARKIGRAHV